MLVGKTVFSMKCEASTRTSGTTILGRLLNQGCFFFIDLQIPLNLNSFLMGRFCILLCMPVFAMMLTSLLLLNFSTE